MPGPHRGGRRQGTLGLRLLGLGRRHHPLPIQILPLTRSVLIAASARVDQAKPAAAARWGLKATHKGNLREAVGIDIHCYVLNDQSKTAVISQRGMAQALALGEGGRALPRFTEGKKVAAALGAEIHEKIATPLIFKGDIPGVKALPVGDVHGYDVTLLMYERPLVDVWGFAPRLTPARSGIPSPGG